MSVAPVGDQERLPIQPRRSDPRGDACRRARNSAFRKVGRREAGCDGHMAELTSTVRLVGLKWRRILTRVARAGCVTITRYELTPEAVANA